MAGFKKIESPGESLVVEKKSRFIGGAYPASSEEEALAIVNDIKKKYYDARHNCYAYSVGLTDPKERYSDDGEPQGTAGRPILSVISGDDIHNIVIVVTRYFGGTLLGTGGLVRAYGDAARQALDDSVITAVRRLTVYNLTAGYSDSGRLERYLENAGAVITGKEYTDKVSYILRIPTESEEAFETGVMNILSGTKPQKIEEIID